MKFLSNSIVFIVVCAIVGGMILGGPGMIVGGIAGYFIHRKYLDIRRQQF
jgi:hypothetical protein